MEQLDRPSAVQAALERMLIKYPSLSRQVIMDIFKTAVEAKADDDQVLVSEIEMSKDETPSLFRS